MSKKRQRPQQKHRERSTASPEDFETAARRQRFCDRLLLMVVLSWVFLLGCTPMKSTDIWWHLRTGQLIWQMGWVPQIDLYTFTDANQPWTDLHWGFQLLALGLYNLGGVDLLVLAKAACLTATVAIGWHASGLTLRPWAKALLWLLPIVCLSGRALVRPEMLTLIFLAAWLWIITRLPARPRLIWLLPVLQVVWVNVHALFVLGLAVGGAYVADRLARHFFGGRWGLAEAPEHPQPVYLFRAGVLVLLASLINPYFEEGALFPFVLYRKFSVDQAFYASIGEFTQPIDFIRRAGLFSNMYLLSEVVLWLLAAASFVWLALERRVSVLRLLLFAAFSHLAWEASRNTSIFALVAGYVLCGNVCDAAALRHSRTHDHQASRRTARRRKSQQTEVAQPPGIEKTTIAALALYAGLIVSVVSGYWTEWGGENKRFALGETKDWYIHDAARFAGQPGVPQRAFVSNFGQAAVFSFHNAPEQRVFMDGRLEVISKPTFALFRELRAMMARGDLRWQAVLSDEKGNLPVLVLDTRFARPEITGLLNTPGWRLVFADKSAAVFLDDETAERLELPQVDYSILIQPPEH